jgi:RNA polymerase sigma factor (sigma-70 family)
MGSARTDSILRHVRTMLAGCGIEQLSDRDLLYRFGRHRDESCFAELVRRHGPMVLAVCRRALANADDAEDAFQAVFLVLARKARARGWQESVANWLYLVAHRLAVRLRADIQRQRRREAAIGTRSRNCASTGMLSVDPLEATSGRELCAALDEELSRLPQRLRAAVVLCCLEGRARDEAAHLLGWSLGTLKRHLEQGRAVLRARLERRGFTLPAALAGALLAEGVSPAAVPGTLLQTAVDAARSGTASSPRVLALVQTFGRGMVFSSPRVAVILLAAGLICGLGWAFGSRQSVDDAPPSVENKQKADNQKPRVDVHGDPLPPGAVARLGTSRLRHLGGVFAVAFSPDGKILASGGADHLIRLSEPTTGGPIRVLPGHVAPIRAIAFSPDGKVFASAGGSDQTVRLWNPATGREIGAPIPAHSAFVAFASTGNLLAFDGRSFNPRGPDEPSRVRLWDYAAGKEVRSWQAPRYTSAAAFSPNGNVLATGAWDEADNAIHLWEVATGKELRRCSGIRGAVACVTFAPDGKTLATGSGGYDQKKGEWFGGATIWDTATAKELCNLPGEFLAYSVQYTPDGQTLMVSDDNGKITFWDITDLNSPRRVWEDAAGGRYLALSRDGRLLARGKGTTAVQIMDVATRTVRPPHAGHTGDIKFVAFTPDGRHVISAGESVHEWDAVTGKEIRELPAPLHLTRGGGRGLFSAALTLDGKALLTGSCEGTVLWDLPTGKPLRSFHVEHGYALAAAISPDGKTLITATELQTPVVTNGQHGNRWTREDFLRVWDLATGKEVRQIGKEPWVRSLVFSPNGKLLASTGDSWSIEVWDIPNEKRITINEAERSKRNFTGSISFSPDSRLLAAGDLQGAVQVWNAATGEEVRSFRGHRAWITATAFSPDGKALVSASADHSLRLWDVATGKLLHEIRGHRDEVRAVAFSPDGKRVASASTDTTILVWDFAALDTQTSRFIPPPTAEELQALWAGLGSRQSDTERSVNQLIAAPEMAVPYLKDRLTQESPHKEKIKRLIAELDSDSFTVREKASGELEKQGETAILALRRILAGSPSLEVRRRVERLLAAYREKHAQDQQPIPEQLRVARAAGVLDRIGTPEANKLLPSLAENPFFVLPLVEHRGRRTSRDLSELEGVFYGVLRDLESNGTPEARQLLKVIAAGASDARLTREAKAVLERLQR